MFKNGRKSRRKYHAFTFESLEPRHLMAADVGGAFATSQPIGLIGTSEIVRAESISSSTDVDIYRFEVRNGQRVGFDIDTPTNGPPGLGSYIRLFDSSGRELASNNDRLAPGDSSPGANAGSYGFDSYIEHTFSKGGTYYVGVSNWQHRYYDPISGSSAFGGDERWLTGSYSLVFTSQMADLFATQFSYSVDAESANRFPTTKPVLNGPVPVNVAINVQVSIRNSGSKDSGAFSVGLYLSRDLKIEISDARVRSINVQSIPTGAVRQLSNRFILPASSIAGLFGSLWLGSLIDNLNQVVEISESNNANRGTGIDRRFVQLFDPISSVSFSGGFNSEQGAKDWLIRNGFFSAIPLTGDVGWTRPISERMTIYSPFDGTRRPGDDYRQHAFVFAPGGRWTGYDISSQSWKTRTFTSYTIMIQGTPTTGEPNPYRAIRGGLTWINYVRDWHNRF